MYGSTSVYLSSALSLRVCLKTVGEDRSNARNVYVRRSNYIRRFQRTIRFSFRFRGRRKRFDVLVQVLRSRTRRISIDSNSIDLVVRTPTFGRCDKTGTVWTTTIPERIGNANSYGDVFEMLLKTLFGPFRRSNSSWCSSTRLNCCSSNATTPRRSRGSFCCTPSCSTSCSTTSTNNRTRAK